jgi:Coenzyme PQQ synthesis protein D (PqqD)
MNLTDDSVVVQDTEPVAARVDGDVVMLSEREGAYFGLNSVGSKIWDLIAEPRRIRDIRRLLAEQYEIDDDTLTRELTGFLEELLSRKLVRLLQ